MSEPAYSHQTFRWRVSVGSGRSMDFKNVAVAFGDGYEQVAAMGINPELRTWDILILRRNWMEIREIETFLKERGGRIPFYFTPEETGIPILVRTDGPVRISIDDNQRETISVTFKEWRGS